MQYKKWDELPEYMKCEEVRPYYEYLSKKKWSLRIKGSFDRIGGLILCVVLALPMLIIGIMIKIDSDGPVFYRQERVTIYGKRFYIHKFRTMVNHADRIGALVTSGIDSRITRVGTKLRRLRLDELPQVFDLISGNMSFVGTRPEVVKYVEQYSAQYMATLLMPAGITSMASLTYKDEANLLFDVNNIEKEYIESILPKKMELNLQYLLQFSVGKDISIIFKTIFGIFK